MRDSIKTVAMQAVHVSCGSSWAHVCWRGVEEGGHYAGELGVHSSFGSWSHRWHNTGRPIEEFLADADFDYLMGKLTGARLEFDYEASLLAWKRALAGARRRRELTAEEMRQVWDDSCYGTAAAAECFVARLVAARPAALRGHPLWDAVPHYVVGRRNSNALQFWQQLWPAAREHLREVARLRAGAA